MTCTEHLRQKNPKWTDDQIHDFTRAYCPWEVGIDYPPERVCIHSRCSECWGTEIPETEIKKENENMPTHAINAREVTKEDLLREIKAANEHIHRMEDQIKNLERYKQYENMANEFKAMHSAFMNSGFSDEQAFRMMETLLGSAMPSILRSVGL